MAPRTALPTAICGTADEREGRREDFTRRVGDRLAALNVGGSVLATDHGSLMVAKIWIPYINDQDRAVTLAAVPCLMLARVVEGECPAFDPIAGLTAYTERAFLGNDQWQVGCGWLLDRQSGRGAAPGRWARTGSSRSSAACARRAPGIRLSKRPSLRRDQHAQQHRHRPRHPDLALEP